MTQIAPIEAAVFLAECFLMNFIGCDFRFCVSLVSVTHGVAEIVSRPTGWTSVASSMSMSPKEETEHLPIYGTISSQSTS